MNRLAMNAALRMAPGWKIDRVVGQSPLFGANGMKVGGDGRLVVAQAFGSQMSTVDVEWGACEALVGRGGAIVGPLGRHPGWRCHAQKRGTKLQAMVSMVLPPSTGLNIFAGADRRCFAEQRLPVRVARGP